MSKQKVELADELEVILNELKNIERLLKEGMRHIKDPIFSTEELMQITKASRRTIQRWRDNNLIAFSAVNGKFYYRLSSLEKMLNNHLQKMEG